MARAADRRGSRVLIVGRSASRRDGRRGSAPRLRPSADRPGCNIRADVIGLLVTDTFQARSLSANPGTGTFHSKLLFIQNHTIGRFYSDCVIVASFC
jgi:hypothetical protein